MVLVKSSILEVNSQSLLEDFKSYKKLDYFDFSLEEFGMKEYFSELNLEDSRMKFRSRAATVLTCSSHYPSDPENIKNMFQCGENGCTSIDTILHWETANCYSHLKVSNSLSNDRELCQFYRNVIQHRMNSIGIQNG